MAPVNEHVDDWEDKTVSIGSNEIALRYRSIFIFRMFMFILLEVALLFFPESTLRAVDLSLLLFFDFLYLRWGGGFSGWGVEISVQPAALVKIRTLVFTCRAPQRIEHSLSTSQLQSPPPNSTSSRPRPHHARNFP